MKFSLRCKKSRYMCIHIALWKLDLANGYYVLVHIFAACTSSSTHPHISVLLYKWWTRPGFFQNWVLEVYSHFWWFLKEEYAKRTLQTHQNCKNLVKSHVQLAFNSFLSLISGHKWPNLEDRVNLFTTAISEIRLAKIQIRLTMEI